MGLDDRLGPRGPHELEEADLASLSLTLIKCPCACAGSAQHGDRPNETE